MPLARRDRTVALRQAIGPRAVRYPSGEDRLLVARFVGDAVQLTTVLETVCKRPVSTAGAARALSAPGSGRLAGLGGGQRDERLPVPRQQLIESKDIAA